MNEKKSVTWDLVLKDHYNISNLSQKIILEKILIFKDDIIFKDIDINDSIKKEFIMILDSNEQTQNKLENKILHLSKSYENNRIEYLYYKLLKFIRLTIVSISDIKHFINWVTNSNKFILSGIQILDLLMYNFNIKDSDLLSYSLIKLICKFKSLFSNKLIYNKLLLTDIFNNGLCITYNKPNFIIDDNVIDLIKYYIDKWNDRLTFYVYKKTIYEVDYIYNYNYDNKIIKYTYNKLNKEYDMIGYYLNKSVLNVRLYKRYNEVNKNDINKYLIDILSNIYLKLLEYFDSFNTFNIYINNILNKNINIQSYEFIKYHFNMLNNILLLLLIESKSPLLLDILYHKDYDKLNILLTFINHISTNDINYIINIYNILYNNILDCQEFLKNKFNTCSIYRIQQLSSIHDIVIKYFKIFSNNYNISYTNYLHIFYYNYMIYINNNNNKIYNYHINNDNKCCSERSKKVFKIITGLDI